MEDGISSLREAQEEFLGVDAVEKQKIKPRRPRKNMSDVIINEISLGLGHSQLQLVFLNKYLERLGGAT